MLGSHDWRPAARAAARARPRAWIALAVLTAALLAAGGCRQEKQRGRPNVILVVVDTLRADHLSQAGYGRPTSEALGRFAANATWFPEAYAPAPWTGPSTASILTGLLPLRHGSMRFGTALSEQVDSLAEILQSAGWRTAGFSHNPQVSRTTGYDQGFEKFEDYRGPWDGYPDFGRMIAEAEPWVGAPDARPFFLYLQPMNVHGPYRVPEAHRAALLDRPPSTLFQHKAGFMLAIMEKRQIGRRKEVTNEYVESLVEQYDTAIRYTADTLGAFFDRLEASGLYDSSLIIVTSDHGEELFDHGGFTHGHSLYRELLNVPLLIKLPGQRRGRVSPARVSLIDLVPTILEAVGLPGGRDLDGRSLLPLLEGRRAEGLDGARILTHRVDWEERCVGRAILSGRYKLVEIDRDYAGDVNQVRLFDLQRDPGERTDIAPAHREMVETLRAELALRGARALARAVKAPPNRLREMEQEKLRALGYL